jgi:hypothetical protein
VPRVSRRVAAGSCTRYVRKPAKASLANLSRTEGEISARYVPPDPRHVAMGTGSCSLNWVAIFSTKRTLLPKAYATASHFKHGEALFPFGWKHIFRRAGRPESK